MEYNNELLTLIDMIKDFISGENRSLDMAGKIEVALDRLFPTDNEIQEFVTNFALYRPGGGEFLVDEISLTNDSKLLLNILQSKYENQ